LVAAVAFDADAKHVVDGLAESVESGARQCFAIIQVVVYPKAFDVIITDPPCSPNGVNEPNVLSKGVNVSHFCCFFPQKYEKKL
jgi:hypothetical protein